VLDFADNLIDLAITKEYREARGEMPGGEPARRTIRKELDEPTFLEPDPAGLSANLPPRSSAAGQ